MVFVSNLNADGSIDYRFERMVPQLEQPWYFNHPSDIEVASDGSVWIADTDNSRIQHLSNDGTIIQQFGSEILANGQAFLPKGIALASDGSLWIVDSHNGLVYHFKPDGTLLSQSGSLVGSLNSPNDIEVAMDGSVWIADTDNSRIQHYSANGQLIQSIKSQVNLFELISPSGLSIAEDNSLWVVDSGNSSILHFKVDGSVDQFGVGNTAAERLTASSKIAVSPGGALWIANPGKSRIEHLSTEGVYLKPITNDGGQDRYFASPEGIAIAPDGSLWIADSQNSNILHLKTSGDVIIQFHSNGNSSGKFNYPQGIDVAPDNSVWVADTENHRIQQFNDKGEFLKQFGIYGSSSGQFASPKDVAVAMDGSIWVADTLNNRLQHFNSEGVFLAEIGNGRFINPKRLAIARDGSLWVADLSDARIQHTDVEGKLLLTINAINSGGLSIAIDDSLWIIDQGKIHHLQADGRIIEKIDGIADAIDIAAQADGSLWVLTKDDVIKHVTKNGNLIFQLGGKGSSAGLFASANSISLSVNGNLWVVDSLNDRVQKFIASSNQLTVHPYKAIILAGGGEFIGKRTNNIWEGTWRVAQKAYRALNLQGFKTHDEIKFLTAGNLQFDLDGNKQFDDLELATKDSLKNAIIDWAKDANDVVIYLADHGGLGKFQVNGTEILTSEELNSWISILEQQISGRVTSIVESCNSGSFISTLAKPKRFLFASAQADQAAVISNNGLNSFSYTFWSEVSTGAIAQNAFKDARQAMSATFIDGKAINAQTDADGDGKFNQQDFDALGDYCFGNCNIVTAGAAPVIQTINPNQLSLNNATTLDLAIKVDHLQPLSEVWALIQRPDDQTSDSSIPLNFEKIMLTCDDKDKCTAKYNNFDTQGNYRFQFYALDVNKEISLPETLTVTQTEGKVYVSPVPQVKPIPSISQPSGKYPVEYDEQNQILHLVDVVVNGQNYQADLQFQGGQFSLVTSSVKAIDSIFTKAAQFDPASGFLSIPLARAFGQDYTAKFKHLGNYKFSIESATPK